jgi:hypothetical protein
MKKFIILTFLAAITVTANADDFYTIGNFSVTQLTEEGVKARPPFYISDIKQSGGELRIYLLPGTAFIELTNISKVARLINKGQLDGQFSDSENAKTIPLLLKKEVSCHNGKTYRIGYNQATPQGCSVTSTRHYLSAAVTLKRDQDLAIGVDPDFLWIIERNK